MYSSDSEFDCESSSSTDSFSISKQLDEQNKDARLISSKMSRKLVQFTTTYIPILVSTMFMDGKGPHGGSTFGRRYIHRDRKERHELIINDYFKGDNSKYTIEHFRRRFQMDVELFSRILYAIGNYDDYFTQKIDAVGKCGLSPLQKMIAALRVLAYGCAADLLDEYVQIGESTAIESLKHFCDAIIGVFEEQYLRRPTKEDIVKLLKEGDERGFPGMLGSLDCMHWQWKNCPTAWHGSHTNGFKKVPTLVLEAVASRNLWIWHAFFGMAGSNNDINILNRSPLFDDLINGVAPSCDYVIQGHHYSMGYYLSDGIYPPYATLIQTISEPSTNKERLFAKRQEAVRKDVERAFGVLQSRWHIVRGPARMWKATELGKIMKTCIILHNMIIESEHGQGIDTEGWVPEADERVANVTPKHDYTFLISRMIDRLKLVRDTGVHEDLKIDLINHLWETYGGRES
ncbi:hypothetical protein OROMI_028255 [Orobanche minor]